MCSKLSFDDWFSLEIDRLTFTSEDEHTLLNRYLRNRSSFEDFKFKNKKFVGWKDDMCFPVDVSCSEFRKYLRFLSKNLNESRALNILWTREQYYVEVIRARAIMLTTAAKTHCNRNGSCNLSEYIERIRTACKGDQNSYSGERVYDWIMKSAQRNMN